MTQHSIEAKTLPELKQLALEELGLTREAVKQHGDLRSRSTWLKAINQAYKDGLTTQEYKELPVIKATALQDNVTDSDPHSALQFEVSMITHKILDWHEKNTSNIISTFKTISVGLGIKG
jgi:hypothetical protein